MHRFSASVVEDKLKLSFNGVCIAIWHKPVDVDTIIREYLQTYGYMAYHRAEWNKGNWINWSDDNIVHISMHN